MSLTIKDKLVRAAAAVAMIGGLKVVVPVVKDLTELRNGTHQFGGNKDFLSGSQPTERIPTNLGNSISTQFRLK